MHRRIRSFMTLEDERTISAAVRASSPGTRFFEADPWEPEACPQERSDIAACRGDRVGVCPPDVEPPVSTGKDGRTGFASPGPIILIERSLIRNGLQLYSGSVELHLTDDHPSARSLTALLGVLLGCAAGPVHRWDPETARLIAPEREGALLWPDAQAWLDAHPQRALKDRRAPRYYRPASL